MKIIHGSLKGLLEEVKERKTGEVRVAALMQSDTVVHGVPQYTSWIIVTALLDWERWTEWRHLVGRGKPDVGEQGFVVPEKITALMKERLRQVRARVEAAGLRIRDGIVAADGEGMDGVLD